MFESIFLGLASTTLLFALSTVLVVGIKVCLLTLKKLRSKRMPMPPPVQVDTAKKRRTRTVRTIEIDPELAERIYFKKSS